jgi:hypothetical protein
MGWLVVAHHDLDLARELSAGADDIRHLIRATDEPQEPREPDRRRHD